MSSIGTQNPGPANSDTPPAPPQMQIVAQFIKDLSFENPGAASNITQRPQIELGVDLNARKMDEQHYEIELKIRVNATHESNPLFLLEVAYAGIFRLQNIPDDATRQGVLMIQGPHILFPFVRRIVADVVRDGGMPPLMIEPIDFVALYQARMAQAASEQPAGTA